MLMHDDLRGQDSVRNRMDSWHLERNQYLTITLYQLETPMGQGGDCAQELEQPGAMQKHGEKRQIEVMLY